MDYPIRVADQLRHQLRALRKKRGLTQTELGQRLGVGQARIAEIERSPGTVSFDQMLKFLSLLDADLVFRDSLPAKAVAEPKHKPAKKTAESAAKRSRARLPAEGGWRQRTLRRKSGLIAHNDRRASTAKDLKELRKLNSDPSMAPTSARHFVMKTKKGSW